MDYIAAFFAAGIVLAFARMPNGPRLPQRFSMSALMISLTVACAVLGMIGFAMHK